MTCEEWRLQISSWEDGELDGKGEPALFGHLSSCEECRLFTRRVRAIRRMLAAGRWAQAHSVADAATPATEGRRAVRLGSTLMLTAIIASIIAAVMFLATPHGSEAFPDKDPSGNIHGYELPYRYASGGIR